VKLVKKIRKCSERNYYIISPRVTMKAIIIVLAGCALAAPDLWVSRPSHFKSFSLSCRDLTCPLESQPWFWQSFPPVVEGRKISGRHLAASSKIMWYAKVWKNLAVVIVDLSAKRCNKTISPRGFSKMEVYHLIRLFQVKGFCRLLPAWPLHLSIQITVEFPFGIGGRVA